MRLLLRWYPYLHALYEAAGIVFGCAYLLGARHSSLTLRLMGLHVTRASPEHLVRTYSAPALCSRPCLGHAPTGAQGGWERPALSALTERGSERSSSSGALANLRGYSTA